MMLDDSSHDPLIQAARCNPWYTDNQFKNQLSFPGSRLVIENRWKFFGDAIRRMVVEHQEIARGGFLHLLDAGCGDGINLSGLANIARHEEWPLSLYGIDYNPVRVARVSKLEGLSGVTSGNLRELPFVDGSFDIVLCNHVLEHVAEDARVLQELRRVLRPKGLLLLGVPNEGCLIAQLRNRVLQRKILSKTDHVNFYTAKILLSRLEEVDFLPLCLGRGSVFFPHSAFNVVLGRFELGASLLMALGRLFPSQSGDLLVAAQRA